MELSDADDLPSTGTDSTGEPVTAEWHPVGTGASRADDTGEWTHLSEMHDGLTETGQDWAINAGPWHRITDTGEWSRGDLAELDHGDLADLDHGGHNRAADDHNRAADDDFGHGGVDTFWEGTRLAGDDPRWVATPTSAPQSPAIYYPAPQSPAASRPDLPLTEFDPAPPELPPAEPDVPLAESVLAAQTGPVEADPLPWHPGHRRPDADRGGVLVAMLWAAAWYVVPLLVLFVWMLALDGRAPAGCVTDAAGHGCESRQAEAAASIVAAAPQFGAALAASVVVAMLLRWINSVWRAATVGLVAAVIGGGLATVLFQLVTRQVG